MSNSPDTPNIFSNFHIRTGEMSEYDKARANFADEVRAVVCELLSTSASIDDVREAHRHVADAVMLLKQRTHEENIVEPGEASFAAFGSFLDRSPLIGAINPIAVPMQISGVLDDAGETIAVGEVRFGAAYGGPPGCVHGGLIAAAFDEVLAVAQSFGGNPGLTANLVIDYRSPVPLYEPLVFRGRIKHNQGRKISTIGTLHHGDTLCAEASGLFVSMRPELFERLLKIWQNKENKGNKE